jgi:hypothetical protein
VRGHGGSIGIEDGPGGRGALFRVALPGFSDRCQRPLPSKPMDFDEVFRCLEGAEPNGQ